MGMLGKTHSEEGKQKISKGLKGEKHPMYGESQTKEWKQKRSKVLKGKPWSAARRAAYERRRK